MGATSPSSTWYFAEGTCRPGFDPYFCLQNPGSTEAQVKITYMKADGTTQEQVLDPPIAASSRRTVNVKEAIYGGQEVDDTAHDFSAKVECTNYQQIVVERPIYFDYNGRTGGHNVMGYRP